MPTLDNLVNRLQVRKMLFDPKILLSQLFYHAAETCDNQGIAPENIRYVMKRELMVTVRMADELYRKYDYPIRIYFDDEELNDFTDEDGDEMDYHE